MSRWISPRVIRGNRGDLLSRWSILWSLALISKDAIDIFCAKPNHVPVLCKGKRLPYGSVYNLIPDAAGWAALWRARIVVWTGGLDLQDDSSCTKLMHTLLTFSIYRLLGLRLIVLMQGAGPLETRLGRLLARAILNRVEVFVARDRGTLQLLRTLGSSARIEQGYDGIFLESGPGEALDEYESTRITHITQRTHAAQPVIAINLRLWFHFKASFIPYQFAKARYRKRAASKMHVFVQQMIKVITAMRQSHDARIVLVSMYEPGGEPWEDDLPFLKDIKRHFSSDDQVVLVEDDLSIPGFFALMSQPDLVIGTRLHSTLVAMCGGVPAIHLSYTLKGRDIFSDLGLSQYVIDLEDFLIDPSPLLALAQHALADSSLPPKINAVRDRVIADNMDLLQRIVSELTLGIVHE